MKKLKILIVEDEIVIAEDLKEVLESLNYQVVGIAIKYSEVFPLIEETEPNLILLDIILGGKKDGVDVAEKLNIEYKIPFVFMTSHADKATVDRAKKVTPLAYLVKPFNKEDIYTTIEMATARMENNPLELVKTKLSEREFEVYQQLLLGLTDPEIGEKLFVSTNTVKTHIKSIYTKLKVRNRAEAASMVSK